MSTCAKVASHSRATLSAIRGLMNPPAPKRRGIGSTADLVEKRGG
jgi:hypothetical protein